MITITASNGLSRTFDLLSWDPQPTAYVTEHPVEDGIDITDHIQRKPDRLQARVIVTNSPLAEVPQSGVPELDAEQFLEQIFGLLLTLEINGQRTRRNYVMEGWPSSRNHQQHREFLLRFKQIRFAQAIAVNVGASLTSSPGSVPANQLGQQALGQQRPSVLSSLLGVNE